MKTLVKEIRKPEPKQNNIAQPRWQRIVLLVILGYEAAGCLTGGALLIAGPNGKYMEMPVDMMNGVFNNFLIPGIILFGLGILTTLAFISVIRRSRIDWFLGAVALGGLCIWFVVEIIILQELHWLHLMWGAPVLLGLIVLIPLIVLRHDSATMQKVLLSCGIFSSFWYVAINIFVPLQYEGYSMLSQAPSELSAIGAPTRLLWILLCILYPLFFAAFGWGVLMSAKGNRTMRFAGGLIIAYSILNFYWPPMHQREVIAAGGGTVTDTLHILWAVMTVLFMMVLMGLGAATLGKKFRLYTVLTFVVFIIFGGLTFMQSSNLEVNLPTPWMGLWERINIAAFMLWVIVFAFVVLQKKRLSHSIELPDIRKKIAAT